MLIHKATYGGVDCTEKIKSMVNGDKLVVLANNSIIGDPKVGHKKKLIINIENEIYDIDEGDWFVFPKSKVNKLGIWYSNNKDDRNIKAIKKSLETIKVCSFNKADIITCVWNKIPDNPFIEVISWYKDSTHLNQILQMLQCLCFAKKIGKYDYVSFLEHDVMYAEGYFDYPDFENGKNIVNMNFGGLNKYGWQETIQKDKPMHQMTMRFDGAINHLKNILDNALTTNSGNIENATNFTDVWMSGNQNIHINHGNHFTSHFCIYDQKKNLPQDHEYWGNINKYKDLL
jgi:hypothetical protein